MDHCCTKGENSDESDYTWNATVSQSNESWPILLEYLELTVFYQDLHLECSVNPRISEQVNLSDPEDSLQMSTTNGVFNISQDSRYYGFEWTSWNNAEEIDKTELLAKMIILKPQELDYNFQMTVRIMVWTGSNSTMYTETHEFWIIGEPLIIINDPPHEGIDIINIYVFSFVLGVGCAVFILWDRRIIGGGT